VIAAWCSRRRRWRHRCPMMLLGKGCAVRSRRKQRRQTHRQRLKGLPARKNQIYERNAKHTATFGVFSIVCFESLRVAPKADLNSLRLSHRHCHSHCDCHRQPLLRATASSAPFLLHRNQTRPQHTRAILSPGYEMDSILASGPRGPLSLTLVKVRGSDRAVRQTITECSDFEFTKVNRRSIAIVRARCVVRTIVDAG
jgi:hypothetical protein